MTPLHEDVLRAALALQVAVFEHISATDDPIATKRANRAMTECLVKAGEALGKLKRAKE